MTEAVKAAFSEEMATEEGSTEYGDFHVEPVVFALDESKRPRLQNPDWSHVLKSCFFTATTSDVNTKIANASGHRIESKC